MWFRSILLLLLLTLSGFAGQFKVFDTMEKTEESSIKTVTLITDKERFVMIPPTGYVLRANEDTRTLAFEGAGGTVALSLAFFTTNTPSIMADENVFKTNIARMNPGVEITEIGGVPSRLGPGMFAEMKKSSGDGFSIMLRHAFISTQEGILEIKYSANPDAYKAEMAVYKDILRTLHTETEKNTTQ